MKKRAVLALAVVAAAVLVLGRAADAATCAGDCDGDGGVAVNEVVRAVTIALGSAPVGQCAAADANADGTVTIAELVGAVSAALGGCGGGEGTPTPTRTPLPTPTGPFVPGCDNGAFAVAYGNVSGGNVVTTPATLDLVAAGEVRDPRSGRYLWSIVGQQCTLDAGFHRGIQVQFLPAPTAFAPGTYTLTPPLSTFVYLEKQENNVYQRAWDTTSATLTVEAVDGTRLRFRIAAAMKPQPLLSFGQTPEGTFDLEVSGTVQRFTSQ